MTRKDILSIQMELQYGNIGKHLLKKAVNTALDAGEWQEDFDIAVTPIMKLDVAAATLIGTLITTFIAGTFRKPPPTPSSPEATPAPKQTEAPPGRRRTT